MKDYILVLPSWYPSKLDAFNGDFNERLVHAISAYRNQVVVYVSSKKNSELKEIELFEEGNIITYKAYFPNSKYKVLNVLRMFRLYYKIFKIVFKKYGFPLLVHTYVFFPAGIISTYLKYRYGLKIILTEHWTIFNEERKDNINTHSTLRKIIYKPILRSFDRIIIVSKKMESVISKWITHDKISTIYNVVDTDHFNFNETTSEDKGICSFIHVSTLGPHKNVLGILRVFKSVIESGYNAELLLIGEEREEVILFINNCKYLSSHVKYLGELPYKKVAEKMRSANVFVLFSFFENMPCVLLESLCCGMPIISSKVGGIAEIVNDQNGILVEPNNEAQLFDAMIYMINNYKNYNRSLICHNAIKSYSYKEIGYILNLIYSKLHYKLLH